MALSCKSAFGFFKQVIHNTMDYLQNITLVEYFIIIVIVK